MSPAERSRRLAARYLDARARWTLADDDEARALREDGEARRAWAVAIATHRAMVGAQGVPSGVEQRRQMDVAMARAGVGEASAAVAAVAAGAAGASTARSWWPHLMGLVGVAAGVLLAVGRLPEAAPEPTAEEWIRARGLHELELPGPRVGVGVGGVTEGGREYEAIASGAVNVEDWLRFSYTNERADLGWLFVCSLQRDGDRVVMRAVAPLPEEKQSLAITTGHFVPLSFEARLAARHTLGPVRFVALFTARPLAYDAVERAIGQGHADDDRPDALETQLRDALGLAAGDVVQTLTTTIIPGSATLPRQEAP